MGVLKERERDRERGGRKKLGGGVVVGIAIAEKSVLFSHFLVLVCKVVSRCR
jgi:hypothetical protein